MSVQEKEEKRKTSERTTTIYQHVCLQSELNLNEILITV